ncbi:hypothetical protein K402DRAFT_413436 [Aulographum hederae CBS 113979]|uniref:Peptidyl-prolyl cis-trans isomerase n=1 Tax=Aulographum hederae CBS 113979 TaxID=1176131 RepID=A0A6G1GWG7_9PEZI|nr:hypothetical protein K402DRAFT_413436 [Aulographum hederae CBS 113979]
MGCGMSKGGESADQAGGAASQFDAGATSNAVAPNNPGNPVVFFDVAIGGKPAGRIQFELYKHVVPKTAENFRQFCVGGSPYGGYKGSAFHRIIPNFMCQGGDFISGDGTGSASIFGGEAFDDENFNLRHTKPGLLSMANSGKNTNGCQFFITTAITSHLDGKHVVFGEVIDGMNVIQQMEATKTDAGDRPMKPVVIKNCGQLSGPTS